MKRHDRLIIVPTLCLIPPLVLAGAVLAVSTAQADTVFVDDDTAAPGPDVSTRRHWPPCHGPHLPDFDDETYAVELADFDGDGFLDAIIGNELSTISYALRNNGAGFFRMTDWLPLDFGGRVSGIISGDLDGDGDLDLAVSSWATSQCNCSPGGNDAVLLNDGSGHLEIVQELTFGGPSHDLALGDFNSDGDLDIFVVTGPKNVGGPFIAIQDEVWENDSTASYTQTNDLPATNAHAVVLGDFDGDGDEDAFTANADPGCTGCTGQNRLYLNDGLGNFTDASNQLPADESYTLSVAVGDVDADGDLDLVLGLRQDTNQLLLNNGNATFQLITTAFPDIDSTYAVVLTDVDGDQDLDVVFGNNGLNRLFLNHGNGSFCPAPHPLPAHDQMTRAISAGDVDGDGDIDLLIGNAGFPDRQNRLYLNNGVGGFSSGVAGACDIADPTSTHVDGNGVPDEDDCPWDLDRSGDVGITDFLALLTAWGALPGHPADFDDDGIVDIADFLALLCNWGPCF